MKRKEKNNELLINVVTQITNFVEKKKLIQHSDVDANRFSKDAQYRYDSILGFAKNEDPEKLIIAFDLAATYGVPQFEVCLTHITYLFITSSFNVVMEKLADDQFLLQLKEQSKIVFQRFKENVWSNIAGTDYQTLITYFSVLNVIDEGKELNGLTLKDHIKLIKKVKATSSEIDYKSLVTQPENLLVTLRPAFNKDNINSLAKLHKTLPNHIRQSLLVNHLYEDWIIEQFKSQDLQDTVSLLKLFMNLCFYLVKLSSDDILNVVRNTIFSKQCIQQLDYGTRQEMMTVVLQNCQKESENNNWSPGLIKALKAIENHLLQVSIFYKSLPAEALTILQRLDTAYEDKEKMMEVLESAVLMSTIKYDSLQALVKYILPKETLTVPITRLLKSSHISISNSVNTILMRIEQCLNNEVKSDEWISLIESLTKQTYLEPQVRLKAVQLLQRLEKTSCNEVESYKRVCEAILGYPIEADKVSTAAGRSEVFKKHLSNATSWEDLCLLEELLKAWPQSDNNLYLELILSLFKFRHDGLYLMLESIFTHVSFPEEFVQQILNALDDNCDMIIICLLSKHKILQEKGLALFKSLPESSDIPVILPRLLVEGNFIASLVDCPIYSKFLETLINEDQRLCKIATDQLIAAGYLAEAGTLYLQHSFVPASLRTFSTAINILSRSEK
uniref:Uncharacterized protein n=1 Tax=Clastoptera arizonana TaxID=38151 RepID=A0A1B6DSA4_9HEMI